MMTIYAMVNAEKEGQIESKMIKAVSFPATRCKLSMGFNKLSETIRRNKGSASERS